MQQLTNGEVFHAHMIAQQHQQLLQMLKSDTSDVSVVDAKGDNSSEVAIDDASKPNGSGFRPTSGVRGTQLQQDQDMRQAETLEEVTCPREACALLCVVH